eukprot:scaffold25055_cov106-Isochrysis_galbana.AAC.3
MPSGAARGSVPPSGGSTARAGCRPPRPALAIGAHDPSLALRWARGRWPAFSASLRTDEPDQRAQDGRAPLLARKRDGAVHGGETVAQPAHLDRHVARGERLEALGVRRIASGHGRVVEPIPERLEHRKRGGAARCHAGQHGARGGGRACAGRPTDHGRCHHRIRRLGRHTASPAVERWCSGRYRERHWPRPRARHRPIRSLDRRCACPQPKRRRWATHLCQVWLKHRRRRPCPLPATTGLRVRPRGRRPALRGWELRQLPRQPHLGL